MKSPVPVNGSLPRNSKVHRNGWLCLASTTLICCLGVSLWNRTVDMKSGSGRRIPAGQCYADLRSLAAAMRYLIEPDASGAFPTRVVGDDSPGLVGETGSQRLATFNSSSKRMVGEMPTTNRPARS